ncbi:hypothetical protein BCON_0099g00240 [Botryotinia convoluta]|uniref:DUF7924 domain-containing protein n=1 Tax=Botryotinia convoluta TaxID=54673 RepID=A0A4Z1I083_9HELO|nr:hypothetical protein BCON_0099g00240 [Botryotinia convoluta]
MITHKVKRDLQKAGQQPSRPQSSSCKSTHLEKILLPQEQPISKDRNTKSKQPFPSLTSNTSDIKFSQIENHQLKRKRLQNEATIPSIIPFEKRLRPSTPQPHTEDTICKNIAIGINKKKIDPLEYWTKELCWPKEYFEPEGNMNHLFARKKSSSTLRDKQSEAGSSASSSITPSDQKPREAKSAPYQSPQYKILLETKGSFMRKSDLGIADTSKTVCRTLLEAEQIVPEDSLFQDDLFEETCEMIQDRNEAKVIQDIARLIVPSAQSLAIRGAKRLNPLIESVNEGWNNSIALTKPRPQPDYAVGFKRTAFTEDQLKKIQPFIGGFLELSLFMGTYYMYFPFLTCEVKCGTAALDIADRQNAHSMTLAVRGIVELFRLVKREKELHREILAFSISHDHRTVRIYGHYPIINKESTTFYRHPIRTFDFTELDGKEKWTAYKFTKNVYDIWMPIHLKRICSIIDDLPSDLNFEVSQQSELGESGLSQGLESHNLFEQTSYDAVSLNETDSQSNRIGSGHITPDTLLSQEIEKGVFKKPKKRGRQ